MFDMRSLEVSKRWRDVGDQGVVLIFETRRRDDLYGGDILKRVNVSSRDDRRQESARITCDLRCFVRDTQSLDSKRSSVFFHALHLAFQQGQGD